MTTSKTSVLARPTSAASDTVEAATIGEPARGLLHLAVLGSPEVVHDGRRLTFALRKAQAFPISTSTIQAIRVHQNGGPEQLKLEQISRPEPQVDEVLHIAN